MHVVPIKIWVGEVYLQNFLSILKVVHANFYLEFCQEYRKLTTRAPQQGKVLAT